MTSASQIACSSAVISCILRRVSTELLLYRGSALSPGLHPILCERDETFSFFRQSVLKFLMCVFQLRFRESVSSFSIIMDIDSFVFRNGKSMVRCPSVDAVDGML